jgi:hypothetical protein
MNAKWERSGIRPGKRELLTSSQGPIRWANLTSRSFYFFRWIEAERPSILFDLEKRIIYWFVLDSTLA